MITQTHRHKLSGMKAFKYRVNKAGVFVLSQGEWLKSSVSEFDLVPLSSDAADGKEGAKTKYLATSKRDGNTRMFEGMSDVVAAGFSRYSVFNCLRGSQQSHKGYQWEKV